MHCHPPFYIVGVPRSGTTLMAVLLNNHSEIYVGKTTASHSLLDLHRRLMDSYGRDGDVRHCTLADRLWHALPDAERPAGAPAQTQAQAAVRHWVAQAHAEAARQHGKLIWGDKSPFMLNFMPQLTHLMPDVRFIHVIRDGRAVADSRCRRRGHHPRLAIHEWKRMILLGQVDGAILGPERYLEVQFEALLADPPGEMARVCRFLGVAFEPPMLDLAEAEGTQQADAYVGNTFDRSKVDGWKDQFTPRQIAELEAIAGDLLQALGYALECHSPAGPFNALSPLAVIWYYQQLSFRDLVRPRRTAMINQQVVEVEMPLAGRLRRFLSESAGQYLNERVIECFRRRRPVLD